MGLTSKIKEAIKKPTLAFTWLSVHGFLNFVPDKTYLKIAYSLSLKKKLNLKNPQTFNEKLQWLKLYDRKPEYAKMVDKYEVREYIASKIGEEYLIPLVGGPWNSFDEIDFHKLPDQFVLKTTHDSGGVVICRNKAEFDKDRAKTLLTKSLNHSFFWRGREWPYKNCKPRIIAEKYMEDSGNAGTITDYKFYCFGGKPEFLYISEGLENHATAHISFVTLDWNFAKYGRSDYMPYDVLPEKPSCFEDMLKVCCELSDGHAFLRVDLYQINSKIYFSELTFFPCSGLMPFKNKEHDLELGKMVNIQGVEANV